MANISKQYFEDVCSSKLTCKEVWHPWTNSCTNAAVYLGAHTILGSCKFYFVAYMFRTILNRKKINAKFIKNQTKSYVDTIFYATYLTSSYSLLFCIMRCYMESLSYYSVLIAGTCASFSGFLQPPENLAIDLAIFANAAGETMFGYLYPERNTMGAKFKETLLFMIFSAVVMFLMRSRNSDAKLTNLWFYHPSELRIKQQENATSVCAHQNSCFGNIYKGFLTYSFYGYAFEALKHFLSARPTSFNLKETVKFIVSKKKMTFGLFLGGYVGIYRALICLLRQKNKIDHAEYSIIAGFVAGSTYLFQPSISVLVAAVVTIIQLLFERIPHIEILKMYVPFAKVAYLVCSGFSLHSNLFLRDACPRNVDSMLKFGTNGKANAMFGNFGKIIQNLKK